MIVPPCATKEDVPRAFGEVCEELAVMLPWLKVAVREGRTKESWSSRFGVCVTFLGTWGLAVVLREIADTMDYRLPDLFESAPREVRQYFSRRHAAWPRPYSRNHLELLEQVKADWREYIATAPVDLRRLVDEHYRDTALGPLSLFGPFDNIYDLNYWLYERDTLEFFVIGLGDAGWDPSAYQAELRGLDPKLREALEKQASYFEREEPLSKSAVGLLNVDWYPERFWWRHYPWLEGETREADFPPS